MKKLGLVNLVCKGDTVPGKIVGYAMFKIDLPPFLWIAKTNSCDKPIKG